MEKRKIRSFGLLSSYDYYLPGIGGMFALLGMFLVGAVLGNLLVLLIGMFDPNGAATYGTVISYPVMFIPAMLYSSAQSRRNEFFGTGFRMDNRNFGMFKGGSLALSVSVATLAAAFVMDITNAILPPMPESLERVFATMMDLPIWLTLLMVSVFAPFFEEWLCRGMILRGLLQKMKPGWAILISAAFFAVIHMNPWQAIPAFALGLLFGLVYWRTGSLKLTMLMHCVNNTLSTILSYSGIAEIEEATSFMDIMARTSYIILFAACIVMLVYFVVRMFSIPLPFGGKSGCEQVDNIDLPDVEKPDGVL